MTGIKVIMKRFFFEIEHSTRKFKKSLKIIPIKEMDFAGNE